MTPIQQHEQELRTMMERAGLTMGLPQIEKLTGRSHEKHVVVSYGRHAYVASSCVGPEYWESSASHPDPRIALRHCLEMAGLVVDRPPVTDDELQEWLVERAGPCDFMDRWSYGGYTIRRLDSVWVFWHTGRPLERSIYARELGAILWCAERWLEVAP